MPTPSELMSALLDYVIEQAKDIDPRAFNLARIAEFKRYVGDLQGLPGVDFNIALEGDHQWLRVARLEPHPPPTFADDDARPYVVIADDPKGAPPSVRDTALAHQHACDVSSHGREAADRADAARRSRVQAALQAYVPLWQAWAAGEQPRRRTIDLYGDLFALNTRLESEEAVKPIELVWGIGLASWQLQQADTRADKSKVDFAYPLLTQAVELDLDRKTLAIALRPRATEPRLEFDAFAACDVPNIGDVQRSARTLLSKQADRPLSPFDAGTFEPILKLVQGNLSATARYDKDAPSLPPAGPDLVVTDLWVLMARPRQNHFLIDDIERLKARVQAGDPIPAGPAGIVTEPSDEVMAFEPIAFRGLSGRSTHSGEPRELLFPLPYNTEQETIVEHLERSPGVAVQGPPGTGKTHTIANIICHYLATGRKILVTSKGEPALKVLQEKIPEAVRPLTVALLSGDKEGMRQFQTSIEAIIHNLTHLNPRLTEDEIATCQSAIGRVHDELVAIDNRIDAIAQAQLSDIEVDDVPMRASKMAALVVHGRAEHGWFDDMLTLSPEHAPPFDETEGGRLRAARRRLGADLVYVGARIPDSHALLPASEVGALHDVLLSMRDIERAEASGELLPLRALTEDVLAQARTMLGAIEIAHRVVLELEDLGASWVFALRDKCRRPEFATERAALEAVFPEIQALLDARAAFLQRPVTAPLEALEHPTSREAIARAAETGKPFGMLSFRAGDAKAHLAAIRVAGLPPASRDDWAHIKRYVDLHARVLSFSVRWNAFAGLLSVPEIDGGVERLREIAQIATAAQRAHLLATTHDIHLPLLAEQVFAQAPKAALLGGARDLEAIRAHLQRHLTHAELARAAANLATLQEKLAGTSGPVSDALRAFVDAELGADAFTSERIVARYAELLQDLRRIESLAHDIALVRDLSARIEQCGAVRLAARLRTIPAEATGDDAVWPVRWREAWTWARLVTHLEAIDGREELLSLAARRRDLERGLARLYEQLVSRSAWLATKRGASERVLSALETYRTAVRRIGQGTGPNATRHRRDAQHAMMEAQGAVPCWIMSHARVSETLPAKLGCFDLVIVDEASQSDLWALPAVLRGKRILVVGDDRQVSPDGGFISAAKIQELRNRFLAGQPHAALLTAEKSLYDIASSVFAASKVMLREHFRCVPPIIAYSNRVFYRDFIQPLRIPKASERLDPPLVDVYVVNGHRDGKDVNRPEAEFIAAEIETILADPAFAGRTLGVVSLLGPDQAQYIDQLVRRRCDVAELARRHFTCGDARVFQGSERDIMFLSMVADRANHKALAGNMFEQRFNVAASRARDRMYLVRSVTLSELSPADLRVSLLEHFGKPQGSQDESTSLIDLCESGFEKDVYSELFSRGYRVTPQVRAGGFRIDMVVEGAEDRRLAIELDGDEFHGPDRWQADMGRQRVLERAGWTFWRCFASTWTMKREVVLKELLDRLATMGIEPLGAVECVPSLVAYREWGRDQLRAADDAATAALEQAMRA